MPRDGSNIYHRPVGTDAVSDTTIDSAKYNANVADVEQDLNLPRPIVAGGTGASSASGALANLSGEQAKQVITNFSSDTFVPGSFYAATTATGAPVPGNAFAGVCYAADASNMVIEARDLTDPAHPVYVRIMSGGVWSAFVVGNYVQKAGDTMTGLLTLSGDPTAALMAVTKQYADAGLATKVSKAGDTMTGALVLPGNPANPLEAAPKQYVDSAAAGAAAGAVHYDIAQVLTAAQKSQARANIDALKKNYIINGAMMVSQEWGSTTLAVTNNYPVDQFAYYFTPGTLGYNFAQVASPTPGGSPNRLRVTAISGPGSVGSGDYGFIQQRIEGVRVSDLRFGGAAAKTITLQFGCKAPAGTYGLAFVNNTTSMRGYVTTFTIAAGEANTDVVKSVTIPGDVTGTWATDASLGMIIDWVFFAGTSYQTAPNIWTAGNWLAPTGGLGTGLLNGASFELFDVSLTEGTSAPAFQVPDFARELAACQRYYFKDIQLARFTAAAAGAIFGVTFNFPVTMRVTPTCSVSTATGSRSNIQALSYGPVGSEVVGLSITSNSQGDAYTYGETLIANARM